jgi:hypothetical protein
MFAASLSPRKGSPRKRLEGFAACAGHSGRCPTFVAVMPNGGSAIGYRPMNGDTFLPDDGGEAGKDIAPVSLQAPADCDLDTNAGGETCLKMQTVTTFPAPSSS